MSLAISLKEIQQASERLSSYVKHTPILRAEKLDAILGCKVYYKPECLQLTGAYKIRGALNKILTLSDAERARGIIASSSGNHAQGVAYAAHLIGCRATVVLPAHAPQVKIDGARTLGAEVFLHGTCTDERDRFMRGIQAEHGYTSVDSVNDPATMAGQGTVGLEVIRDFPDMDTIVTPLGGGGLTAGVAVAIKETNPGVRMVAAEPARIPRYSESRKAGKPVEVPTQQTVADGLMNVRPESLPYPIIESYVDELIPVEDDYILKALRHMLFDSKLLAEASAAIGLGAVLSGKLKVRPDEKVCFVISGGNIDPETLSQYLVFPE